MTNEEGQEYYNDCMPMPSKATVLASWGKDMTREELIECMALAAKNRPRGVASSILDGKRLDMIAAYDAITVAGMVIVPREGVYKHRKGGTYDRLGAARIQSDEPLKDMDEVVVYRAHVDGSLWARRASEFKDGRFSRATTEAANKKPRKP